MITPGAEPSRVLDWQGPDEDHVHPPSFRLFVRDMTSSSADEWYDFVNRAQGDDDAADLRLLTVYNDAPLVAGSNALAMQEECFGCELALPGLCYPKARRNTGFAEECHACLADSGTFERVPRGNFNITGSAELPVKTMKDTVLLAMGIQTGQYTAVKAPLNEMLNTICPYSINKKKCKVPGGCSLRVARV